MRLRRGRRGGAGRDDRRCSAAGCGCRFRCRRGRWRPACRGKERVIRRRGPRQAAARTTARRRSRRSRGRTRWQCTGPGRRAKGHHGDAIARQAAHGPTRRPATRGGGGDTWRRRRGRWSRRQHGNRLLYRECLPTPAHHGTHTQRVRVQRAANEPPAIRRTPWRRRHGTGAKQRRRRHGRQAVVGRRQVNAPCVIRRRQLQVRQHAARW